MAFVFIGAEAVAVAVAVVMALVIQLIYTRTHILLSIPVCLYYLVGTLYASSCWHWHSKICLRISFIALLHV